MTTTARTTPTAGSVRARLTLRAAVLLAALTMLASGLTVVATATPARAEYGAMHWPTGGIITSKFNWRCSGYRDSHNGIDIANDQGTPVRAAYRGRIVFAGWRSGYGRLVIIDHPSGWRTWYAHLARIRYGKGKRVTRWLRIGRMGQSGNATGPHLHFEIRRYGDPKPKYQNYTCYSRVRAMTRIRARFPGLPA